MTVRARSRKTALAVLATFGLQSVPLASLAAEAPRAQAIAGPIAPRPMVSARIAAAAPMARAAAAPRPLAALRPALASLTADDGDPGPDSSEALLAVPQILFVVGTLPLGTGDQVLKQRMASLGFQVEALAAADPDTTAEDATGKQAVVIAPAVTLAQLGTKFRSVTVPVLVMSPGVLGNATGNQGMGMVANSAFGTTASGQTSVAIQSSATTDPLVAGLTGTVSVNLASSPIGWGTPNANTGSIKAAIVVGQTSQATLFGYTQNAVMPGLSAPARRAFVSPNNLGPSNLNSNGWLLFDTALRWTVSSEALFVVGSTTLTAADRTLRRFIEALGYAVTVRSASGTVTGDATGKRVVVISSTVTPSSVGTKFRTVTVPVVVCDSGVLPNMAMTGTAATEFGTATGDSVEIAQPAHALAAGLSGTVRVTTASATLMWGNPAATAAKVAKVPASSPAKWTLFGYEKNVAMVGGVAVNARRVGVFLGDTTPSSLASDGWALVRAAIAWATESGETHGCLQPLDVVQVIDRSGSMAGQKLTDAKSAAKSFVDAVHLNVDQVGVASFSTAATLDFPLSSDGPAVKAAIDALIANGSTNIGSGITAAQGELAGPHHEPDAAPIIVLLTDGQNTDGDPFGPANAAKAAGIRIIAIGLGTDVNEAELRQIVSNSTDYYFALTSAELAGTYALIAGTICTNAPPVVSAGMDQSITLPAAASLTGSATDDGQPPGSTVTFQWSLVSGPAGGSVVFANPASPTTSATFNVASATPYVLRLTASDSLLTGVDEVSITVSANQAPLVNAGPDASVTLPATGALQGTVSDDGLPLGGSLTVAWSKDSGPGTVSFAPPNSVTSTATFGAAGTYVLRLTANDSALTASDTLTVVVSAPVGPQLSISDVSVAEGHSGLTNATVQVSLSPPAAADVTVQYATEDVTAVTGCDFVSRAGVLTFAPGQTAVPVVVPVVGDLAVESAETFKVRLGSAMGAGIADADGIVTITNDDVTNAPPAALTGRTPADGTLGTLANPTLSWTGGDPDLDALTYDVFLGTSFALDGQLWTRQCPASTTPAPRSGAATAYDEATDRMILFGGRTASADVAEAWVLESATGLGGAPKWTALAPSGGPSARQRAAAAYDAASNRLIVAGGCSGACTTALGDAWVLTNANGLGGTPTWLPLPAAPSARFGQAAAYDAANRRLVLFGGSDGTTPATDVRVLVDATGVGTPVWQTLTAPAGPTARDGASAAYDATTGRVLVFGGRVAGGAVSNQLWSLASANGLGGTPAWSLVATVGTPPAARWGHASFYDPASRRLLFFGGTGAGVEAGTNVSANDAWVLSESSSTWSRLNAAGGPPASRYLAATAYSATRARLVVAGGLDNRATPALRDDLWTLSDPAGRLPLASAAQTVATFVAPAPDNTYYYWRIVSKDTHGAVNGSPAWRFSPSAVPDNQPPTVDAGADQALTLPTVAANLAATVADDGRPVPATVAWTQVSGPDPVTFGTAGAAATSVTLGRIGTYVVRVTVNDTVTSASDDVTLVLAAPACTAPLQMKAWWPADGHSVDLIQGRRATLTGGVGYGSGISGQAFEFDGVDGLVNFGTQVGNFGTSDLTISLWLRTPVTPTGAALLNQRTVCVHSNFWHLRVGGGVMSVALDDPPHYNLIHTSPPMTPHAYHHLAVVRQGPEMRVYIDGVLNTTQVTDGTVDLNSAVPMLSGDDVCVGFDGTIRYQGQLDEVTLFERAVSAEEIARYAATGAWADCPAFNTPPVVDAGPDLSLVTPQLDATLNGSAIDDGRPVGSSLSYMWALAAAPAGSTATFTTPGQASTGVHLSRPGQYTLRLTVSDSIATVSDDVVVTVAEQPDLSVAAVGVSGLQVDGQTLAVSGTLSATVANAVGPAGPFAVTFFEDRNANGTFQPGVDAVLGTASVGGVAAGASVPVSAPASGSVLFAGLAVHALADSGHAVVETDESNNYGSSLECETAPTSGAPFTAVQKWAWTGSSVAPTSKNVMMAPLVADLDRDGVTEVVVLTFSISIDGFHMADGRLRVLNGANGVERYTVNDPALYVSATSTPAVGNLDDDPELEIVAVDDTGNRLIAFEHDGTFKWRSPTLTHIPWAAVSLADLDGDGRTEVIVDQHVLNADGTLRWSGTAGTGQNRPGFGGISIAADLDGDGRPEVIAGRTAYRADGTILWNAHDAGGGLGADGFDAVGNFDSDPEPEVVVVAQGVLYLVDHTGLVVWGVSLPGGGWGGSPTVANVDDDPLPEIGVASAFYYGMFEPNGATKWVTSISDASSHETGSSVFDFEGDGKPEVVHADEVKVRVYNGSDGSVRFQQDLGSGTLYELPVIADVDADGSADIVGVANNGLGTPLSGVFVFEGPFASTRRIWNQHSYHVTNVNEDGNVPSRERASWLDRNSYRQNHVTSGCAFARPDLMPSFVRQSTGGGSVTLTARIGNGGGRPAPSGVTVTFYNGNPASGGTTISTVVTTAPILAEGFLDVVLTVPATTPAIPLWVVADTTAVVDESDETNNAYDSRIFLNAPPNNPPSVAAGPDQRLVHPQNVATLDGTVTDDGQPFGTLTTTWGVVSGPGAVAFGNANATDTSATFAAPGTYVLRLTADDGGMRVSDDLTVVVEPANLAPGVNAGTDQSATGAAALDGTVTDDGLPTASTVSIGWSKVSGPGAVTFVPPNAADTSATFALPGTYVVRLTASDGALAASDEVSVTVTLPTNQPPAVSAGPDRTVPMSAPSTTLAGVATDDGLPAGSTLAVAWQQVAGPAAATIASPHTTGTALTLNTPGTYVFRLAASDGTLASSDDATVVVQPASPTGPAPTATLTSPALGIRITGPIPVVGSAQSGTLASWTLEHRLKDDGPWTRFASGTSQVTNNTLGTLDPTMMLNGTSEVRLTVTDTAGRFAQATTQVVVKEQQKVGNFTVSFVDLEVPVAGLPISVTRSYDSRDKRVGDFGHGWRLSLSDVRIEESAAAQLAFQSTVVPGFFPTYCLQAANPPTVTVTLPDGRVLDFQMTLTPACQPFLPIDYAQVSYVPVGTTLGTLTPANGPDVYVSAGWPGQAQIYDAADFSLFDPSLYRYTSPDGRVFLVHDAEGLKSLSDLNGNVLTVGPNGIIHSSGKSIAFTRDGSGRIQTITDPNGQTIDYAYDGNGDLVSHTDREDHTTTFGYHLEIPHHLVSIDDPLGRRPIRNEYDAEGRLLRHIDAFGKTIEYTHQLGIRREIVTDRNLKQRVLDYDDRGNVLQETDPNGKIVLRTYDARNNRLTETLPHDPGTPNPPKTTYTYDTSDNVLTVTDPENHTTTYTYNTRRQVLTSTDPRGAVTTNVYDDKGNLTSTKVSATAGGPVLTESTHTFDAKGNLKTRTVVVDGVPQVTTYTYDGFGNMTHETDAALHEMSYVYDASGRRTRQTTARTVAGGGTEVLETRYEYDGNGRLTKTIDADGTSSHSVYDALGRQVETFDKLGHRTASTYDEMGRATRTDFADGTFEESTYDNEGRRLTSKNRRGKVTLYTYDDVGRLKRTTFPGGAYTENTYDSAGRLTAVRDARGKTTTYEYDNAGRRTKVTVPLSAGISAETVFTYDANGNQLTVRDPLLRTTTFEYDELNRRTKTILPATATLPSTYTQTTYDTLGRRKTERDQAGRVTTFAYDALGRLTSVTDARGKVTSYGYDELGNRVTQTDANNHVTSFAYDKLGRETKRTLPTVASVSAFETKTYDDAGRLESRTDFAGRMTSYTYDVMSRLLARTAECPAPPCAPNANVTFTYTDSGRRETATDARGVTTWTYDDRDRLESLTYPDGRKLEYDYDDNGNRTALTATMAGAPVLTTAYTYDDANRLDLVTDTAGRVYDHGYDANGNRTTLAQPNGTLTTYTYDTLNRLTNLSTLRSGATIQTYALTLGLAGNRTQITEHDGSVRTYGYDELYRLTSDTVQIGALNQYAKTFVYDDVGNRQTQTTTIGPAGSSGVLVAGTLTYGYDARDRLTSETLAANPPTTYGWDADGNLTTKSGEATYAWDRENRLVRVTKTDGTVVDTTYDFDGTRVRTVTTPPTGPAVTTNYLVDTSGSLSHVIAETNATGALQVHYVRGDDLLALMRPLVAAPASPTDWQTRYYHADHIGSVRRLTNEAGTITDGYTYTAFGEQLAHTGTDPQPYAFTGEPYDPNVGFQYHRARWMDARVGRFVSVDSFDPNTFDPPTLHKYRYARNDPGDHRDPTGLYEGLPAQLIATGIRVTLFAMNIYGFVTNLTAGTVATTRALDAFRRGDSEDGLGYGLYAIMRYGLAALNWIGIKSFISSPPTLIGGAMQLSFAEGGGAEFLEAVSLSNPAVREWAWEELLPAIVSSIPTYYLGPSDARRKVDTGRGPRGIDRIDRPSGSVPGSQWHAHSGPGEGSPAVNLDGTPKHGDNSWITNAIREFLVEHGWRL